MVGACGIGRGRKCAPGTRTGAEALGAWPAAPRPAKARELHCSFGPGPANPFPNSKDFPITSKPQTSKLQIMTFKM
jgi:hypothetical protein